MIKNILITGGAGFIGFHLNKVLKDQFEIQNLDALFERNVSSSIRSNLLTDVIIKDINDNFIDQLKNKPQIVIHLAAETGIAGSLKHPDKYLSANVQGTFNVLEQCRKNGVKYLIYASSSSVYCQDNTKCMTESDSTDFQLSFYGTTKKMGELMVENYCKQFGITAIGLRFFTVYGSWTRPDMAAYKFMHLIKNNQPVVLYNNGDIYRDFTHVSDVVYSIKLLIDKIQNEDIGTHQIFNIGYGQPITVKQYVNSIAASMCLPVNYNFKKLPNNESAYTHCNNDKLKTYINFTPTCNHLYGINEMVSWFKLYEYDL